MNDVSLQHIWAAFCSVGRANLKLEDKQNRKEVTHTLSRMFQQSSQEVEVDQKAVEEIGRLTFRLFDGCASTKKVLDLRFNQSRKEALYSIDVKSERLVVVYLHPLYMT